MSGRRVHAPSGRNYHVKFNPPKQDNLDDVTGEPLIQRKDDLPKTVKHRLAVYHDETLPLANFYKALSLQYFKVDGNQAVDSVFNQIKDGALIH